VLSEKVSCLKDVLEEQRGFVFLFPFEKGLTLNLHQVLRNLHSFLKNRVNSFGKLSYSFLPQALVKTLREFLLLFLRLQNAIFSQDVFA
jgi:hypothetical protein